MIYRDFLIVESSTLNLILNSKLRLESHNVIVTDILSI